MKQILYYGRRRRCPLCTRTFRRFAPGGAERRPDAECPYCYSKERHRFFFLYLQQIGFDVSRKRVLHFAPDSPIEETFTSLPDVRYVTADLYADNVQERVDITRLPHPDRTFDIIICFHVLEHVPDDDAALNELFRVLRRTGILYLMVPMHGERTIEDPNEKSPHRRRELFGQEDHIRLYGRDFLERLRAAGFEHQEVTASDLHLSKGSLHYFGAEMRDESLIVATRLTRKVG